MANEVSIPQSVVQNILKRLVPAGASGVRWKLEAARHPEGLGGAYSIVVAYNINGHNVVKRESVGHWKSEGLLTKVSPGEWVAESKQGCQESYINYMYYSSGTPYTDMIHRMATKQGHYPRENTPLHVHKVPIPGFSYVHYPESHYQEMEQFSRMYESGMISDSEFDYIMHLYEAKRPPVIDLSAPPPIVTVYPDPYADIRHLPRLWQRRVIRMRKELKKGEGVLAGKEKYVGELRNIGAQLDAVQKLDKEASELVKKYNLGPKKMTWLWPLAGIITIALGAAGIYWFRTRHTRAMIAMATGKVLDYAQRNNLVVGERDVKKAIRSIVNNPTRIRKIAHVIEAAKVGESIEKASELLADMAIEDLRLRKSEPPVRTEDAGIDALYDVSRHIPGEHLLSGRRVRMNRGKASRRNSPEYDEEIEGDDDGPEIDEFYISGRLGDSPIFRAGEALVGMFSPRSAKQPVALARKPKSSVSTTASEYTPPKPGSVTARYPRRRP